MRALVCRGFGAGENLSLETRQVPAPGKGEVRVRVRACGANATDWEFVTGRPGYARIAMFVMRGRDIFGSDIVGVVDAIGAGVTGLAPGDRVVADTFEVFGGFAEYTVASEALWVPVPDGIDDVTAATLPQSGTIALTAMRGRVQPGDKVLVNGGGGGSGPLAIQLAKAAGAEVWAVDAAAKAPAMTVAGADHILDFAREDFAAGTVKFNLILDLWGTRTVLAVRRTLAPGGRYMLVGGPLRTLIPLALGGLFTAFSDRKVGLLGVKQGPGDLATLMEMLLDGTLRPVVGEVATLDHAADALIRMGAGQIAGKLVIVP